MPKSQTIEAGCMLFCISISIQGKLVLHFIWNYTCPTPPKSTRLTKSTQFGNEQHFSFWSKRWNYNALRFFNFNFSILTVMKKKEYLSFTSILFSYGEKKNLYSQHSLHPCQGGVKQPTQMIYSASVAFFPTLKHWTSGIFNFFGCFFFVSCETMVSEPADT